MSPRERFSFAIRAMTPAPIETSPTLRLARQFFFGVIRDAVWAVDLDDDNGNPNLMKLVSAVFAIAAVQGALVRHVAVTGFDIGMGFLACCAYAGYRGLKLFAAWKGIQLQDSRQTLDATVHSIIERRVTSADGRDFEPT